MSDLTLVSLFDGIGGFPLAFERAGATTVATVEIDPSAAAVSKRHFPHAHQFDDVTKVTGNDLRAVGFVPERGIITAGWPCQDLSVAGRRAGLDGARSGLWWEVVRLLDETHPRWFVGENVPGLLSSNDGKDFGAVLGSLNDLGYFVNLDILDAQFFGVPQRRKRVFLVCQRTDHILATKTITSALTISQCLTEILGCILAVARRQSHTAYTSSISHQSWCSADGLRMRMRLFGLDAGSTGWQKSLSVLADASRRYPPEQNVWESEPDDLAGNSPRAAMSSPDTPKTGCGQSLNTGLSWNNTWAEISETAKSCITSTKTSATTESTIFTCALALLNISEHIARWTHSSPNYSDAASSASTVLKEFIDYARQTTSSLFGDMAWNDRWLDFTREADRIVQSLGHLGTPWSAPAAVLLEPESGDGDSTAGGETRPGTTDRVAAGAGAVGVLGTHTHTLTSEGADASEDGTGRGIPVVTTDDTHTHTHTPGDLDTSGRRETRLPHRRRISSRRPPHHHERW